MAVSFVASLLAVAQTPPVTLPTYVMAGLAYNQVAGFNGFFSGLTPVSNQAGMYASATLDLLPILSVDANGKPIYLLSSSARAGLHKVIYNQGPNALLLGGDVGASFSSAAVSIAPAGSFTVTFVRQLSPHFAIGIPIRALWVPPTTVGGTGGFNPVVELGLVWRP